MAAVIEVGEVIGHAFISIISGSHGNGGALHIGVVDGSHGERAGRGAGLRDGTGIHHAEIVGVDAQQGCAGAVVAGGHAAEDALLRGLIQCALQEGNIVIEAGGAAQGQVHDVRPQLDAVLHCPEDIIGKRAAGHAEDLQAQDLCVRSNTGDAILAAVTGRDARHMQAVGGGAVVHLIVAAVAVAEGDLLAVVLAIAQGVDDLLGVRLGDLGLPPVTEDHVRVLIVDTGVDDRDHGALTGVAQLFPHLCDGGHAGGIVHLHLEGGDRGDGNDAGQSGDLLHLGHGHLRGEGADQERGLVEDPVAGDLFHLSRNRLLLTQSLHFCLLRACVPLHRAGSLHGRSRLGLHHHADGGIRVQIIQIGLDQAGGFPLLHQGSGSRFHVSGNGFLFRCPGICRQGRCERLNTQAAHQRQRQQHRQEPAPTSFCCHFSCFLSCVDFYPPLHNG